MNKPFLPLNKLVVATVAGIAFTPLLIAQPSLADSIPGNSFPSNNSETDNSNLFSPGNSNFNMFDIIHRANLGNINWNAEEQNQKLDAAAEAFKKIQQQRLQNPQLPNSQLQNSQNNPSAGSPSNEPSANQLLPKN